MKRHGRVNVRALPALSRPQCSSASEDLFRTAAGCVPRPLGHAEAGRRDHLFDLDRRGLLRQTVYVGLRQDKPAEQMRREVARPLQAEADEARSAEDSPESTDIVEKLRLIEASGADSLLLGCRRFGR